jgi:hypothetical protein
MQEPLTIAALNSSGEDNDNKEIGNNERKEKHYLWQD